MHRIEPGEEARLSVSGCLWELEAGEAFFGPARFALSVISGRDDAVDMAAAACGRHCRFRGMEAGVVALVTARQVTTRGRLLTHAWALRVAGGAPDNGATD